MGRLDGQGYGSQYSKNHVIQEEENEESSSGSSSSSSAYSESQHSYNTEVICEDYESD